MRTDPPEIDNDRARDQWLFVWVSICVGLMAAVALFSTSSLPSGADPGNMLAQSYSFDDPSQQITYAPLLPWILARIRHLSDSLEVLSVLIKVLGIALLFFQASGMGVLTFVLGGPRAGLIGYALALASPSAWIQLSWGGYAQFLGVGFGALALAAMVSSRTKLGSERTARTAAAGVAFGLIVLSHAYSVPFFAAACLIVIGSERATPIRNAFPFALAAVVISIPGWPALFRTMVLSDVRASGGALKDALIPISDSFQNATFHPVTTALAFAPFLVACLLKGSRTRLAKIQPLLPWIAGGFALAPLTPPPLMDRLFLIAGHGLTVVIGIALSSLPRPRKVRYLVGLWALSATAATLAETEAMSQRGGRLSLDEARLLRRIGSGGETVAIATDSPSLEGYWFRGLTGGRALIGDSYRWYTRSREREESAMVQNFLLGDYALLGRPLSVVARSPVATEGTLVFDDGVEFCPLFRLRVMTGRARITGSAGALEIQAIEETNLSFSAFGGSKLVDVKESTEGIEMAWEFRYAHYRPRGLVRHLRIRGATLTGSTNGVTLRVDDRTTLEELTPSRRPIQAVWTIDALLRERVSRIVASPPYAGYFRTNSDFHTVDSAGRLVVFALKALHRGEAPPSLELRAEPAGPGP